MSPPSDLACPVASYALLLGCGGFARKGEGCGEKQFWLTGIPRARPRVEGRKRDFSFPLAVPAKNSRVGSFLLSNNSELRGRVKNSIIEI
jgi:hypothetical protein